MDEAKLTKMQEEIDYLKREMQEMVRALRTIREMIEDHQQH